MNCDEARLLIGAEPDAGTPELEAHVQGCSACHNFRAEMRSLEGKIRQALEDAPPGARAASARAGAGARGRHPATWRQWALAAGAALATFAVVGVWLLRPSDSLAHDVVAHVQAESDSWLAQEHVSAKDIGDALHDGGVELDVTSDRITYAHSCWFHGHYVPHLVVQTAQGPATVIILRHERVRAPRDFHEAGMSGVIVPADHGSIAVLTKGGGSPDELAGRMRGQIRWLAEPR